jgi:hypothetical protein
MDGLQGPRHRGAAVPRSSPGAVTVGAASPAHPFDLVDQLVGRHGVAPGRALFIDDHDEYIHGAITAGLDAIQCRDAGQVRAELQRRHVIA